MPGGDDLDEGSQRDDGFPRTDVSLEKALHGVRICQSRTDLLNRMLLGIGQSKGKRGQEGSQFRRRVRRDASLYRVVA